MKIETTEAVKTIMGTTGYSGCILRADVDPDIRRADVGFGHDTPSWTISAVDCNDILQFFYHLRYVLGGKEGKVHD